MSLRDLVVHCEILDGGSLTKEEVLEDLLRSLAAEGHIQPADFSELLHKALKREELGSTGIGSGVALPQAKHASIERPLAMVGLFRPPVEFDSLDGEPVDIFVVFLSPLNDSEVRFPRLLNSSQVLLRQLAQAEFREQVRQCQSGDEIRRVIGAIEGS